MKSVSLGRTTLVREIFVIISLAVFLAVVYNAFSPKGIRLLRARSVDVAVHDSSLFVGAGAASANSQATRIVTGVAPLHERAIKNPDSMAALFGGTENVYRTVSLDQIRRLLEQKKALFFDARNAEDFRKGHIPGAWSIPALEMEGYFDTLMTLPSDTMAVVYCNGADCHLGRMLIDFLKELHFSNLYLYDDGWDGWERAELPVER